MLGSAEFEAQEGENWEDLVKQAEKMDQIGDWIEYFDEDSMKSFYHNTETDEYTWELPDDLDPTQPEKPKTRRYPRSPMQLRVDRAVDDAMMGKDVLDLDLAGFRGYGMSIPSRRCVFNTTD